MFSFFIQTILVTTPNTGERALLQETHGSAATETASLQEKKHSGVLLKGGEKKNLDKFSTLFWVEVLRATPLKATPPLPKSRGVGTFKQQPPAAALPAAARDQPCPALGHCTKNSLVAFGLLSPRPTFGFSHPTFFFFFLSFECTCSFQRVFRFPCAFPPHFQLECH